MGPQQHIMTQTAFDTQHPLRKAAVQKLLPVSQLKGLRVLWTLGLCGAVSTVCLGLHCFLFVLISPIVVVGFYVFLTERFIGSNLTATSS